MMSRRRALALGVLAWLGCGLTPAGVGAANRCAGGGGPRPDEGGIGGTGMQQGAPGDGIGGTGHQPGGEEDDSGVGGTGISAGDTGVIGTITGFASICVGDVEIHYDARSAVRIDGRSASAADLAVGQVVEVVANGSGDELTARQIGVRHVVAGPVTRVDADRNEIDVIGQTVRLAAATASDFTVGSTVQVSGLRQADGVIAASRITAGAADVAWLSGPVASPSADEIAVAGTPVRVTDGTVLSAGDEVRVTGRWDGSRLVASGVDRLPSLPFDGRVSRLDIEGFAGAVQAGQLRVGGYVFDVSPAATADLPAADARVRIEAVVDGHRAVIERVGAMPDLPPRPARPGDAASMRPMHPPADNGRPPGDGGGRASGPPDGARPDFAARPDRPDRPGGPGIPDRPPPIERPPIPDRVVVPERPPRIERPDRPERPGR